VPHEPSKAYLKDEIDDALGRMVFQLLSELWITRDRLAVVEQVLVDKGLVGPREADDYVPSEDFNARIEALRKLMVDNVLGAPLRPDLSRAALQEKAELMDRSEAAPGEAP
jgi:hypothetical protein